MIICVTGTPGSGKTILARKIAKDLNYEYIDVNKIIKEEKLDGGYDKERKCKVVDEIKLAEVLHEKIKKIRRNTVIDSHLRYADEKDMRIRTGGKDACLRDNTLVEHYCDEDGFIQTTHLKCRNGCDEGRCIIGEVEEERKCGVSSFRVSNPCIDDGQIKGYRNAYWQCYDGKSSYEGGPTSCKTSETWQKYAAKACVNRCYGDVIEPTIIEPVEDIVILPEPICPIPKDALRKCPDGMIIPYTSECRHIPPPPPQQVPQIDVVILLDSTGSMEDEIRTVKTHIINIVNEVRNGHPRPDLRIGIVTYRDYRPEEYDYVFKEYDLTRDIDEALSNLKQIEANGGGDHPEAVETGLHVAINKMDWNRRAKKLVFLIGDAAPHGYGAGDNSFHQGSPEGYNYKELIDDARDKGINIYTVSGSGIGPVGIKIWKDIARKTGGEYTKLSYQRRVVEEYYEEEGIDEEWIEVAQASADYDRESNTILTNTLGAFTKSSIMSEAADMGVVYEDEEEDKKDVEEDSDEDDSWLDATVITGESVKVIKPEEVKINGKGLGNFFQSIFTRISSWR